MLFCSEPNGLMDFDDFLDMVSVFHDKCPKERKVRWAFRLYGRSYRKYYFMHVSLMYFVNFVEYFLLCLTLFLYLLDFNDDHVIDYDDLSTYVDLVTDYGMESELKSEIIQRVCNLQSMPLV